MHSPLHTMRIPENTREITQTDVIFHQVSGNKLQENWQRENKLYLVFALPFHSVAPSLTPTYLPAHPFKVPVSRPSPPSVILPALLNNRQLERENMGQGQSKRKSSHYFSFQFRLSFIHLLFVSIPYSTHSIDFH